jgi:quercetin dioxygenase-like cupin family protein
MKRKTKKRASRMTLGERQRAATKAAATRRINELRKLPTLKALPTPFTDARGEIQNVLDDVPRGSMAIITSKKGTVRAQHSHKQDDHYVYVVSGEMLYVERDCDVDDADGAGWVVGAGDCVYTPPRVDHAMFFLEDTVFVTLGSVVGGRKQANYEKDLIRLEGIKRLDPMRAMAVSNEDRQRWVAAEQAFAAATQVAPQDGATAPATPQEGTGT